jgi:hypothetical protein
MDLFVEVRKDGFDLDKFLNLIKDSSSYYVVYNIVLPKKVHPGATRVANVVKDKLLKYIDTKRIHFVTPD